MKIDPLLFNQACPIVEVAIYRRGFILSRQSMGKSWDQQAPRRGRIEKRSRRSLSRLAFTAFNTSVEFKSMITLTYPVKVPTNGKSVQADLYQFLRRSRVRFGLYSYLWFLEFQRRGAPHYHILTTVKNPQQYHRNDMAKIWSEWIVPYDYQYCEVATEKLFHVKQLDVFKVHSHQDAWAAIRKPDGAKRYVLKYALKPEQVIVPRGYQDVGRFWGHSRDVKPQPIQTVDVFHDDFVSALRESGNPCGLFDIVPKYVIRRDVDI